MGVLEWTFFLSYNLPPPGSLSPHPIVLLALAAMWYAIYRLPMP
ncbi:hypothetical protein LCGC14_1584630 [marine sediment metagenome]|uniref:Uncharacterized protein n=1 Tax=marine sediment metagenome TaxID=412755 RepID=A0A0F9LG39_9ZZZZ